MIRDSFSLLNCEQSNFLRYFDESSNSHNLAQPKLPRQFDEPVSSSPETRAIELRLRPGGEAFPRSLVSHVVLKVSADRFGCFVTSSVSKSWTESRQPRQRSDRGPACPLHGAHLPWRAARNAHVNHRATGS